MVHLALSGSTVREGQQVCDFRNSEFKVSYALHTPCCRICSLSIGDQGTLRPLGVVVCLHFINSRCDSF